MTLIQSKKQGKYYTGVALDREVTSYIDDMACRMGWNRSITLNFIVRDYASRKGDGFVLAGVSKMPVENEANSK
jgi:hypothetical protein